jgi:hypothetical protein
VSLPICLLNMDVVVNDNVRYLIDGQIVITDLTTSGGS